MRAVWDFYGKHRKLIQPMPGIILMILLQTGFISADQHAQVNQAWVEVSQAMENFLTAAASIWIPTFIYLPKNDKQSPSS